MISQRDCFGIRKRRNHMTEERHTHTAPDGTVYEHSHSHAHAHGAEEAHSHEHAHNHTHTHTNTKAVLNRLSRAIGHMESIKRMVEDGRDCSEVLIQISAVRSALASTGRLLLQDHIEHCVREAMETGDRKTLDDLYQAIGKFIR